MCSFVQIELRRCVQLPNDSSSQKKKEKKEECRNQLKLDRVSRRYGNFGKLKGKRKMKKKGCVHERDTVAR